MVLGAANGMSTLARASSIAKIFGPRHYGAIAGEVALGANGTRATGPVGASLLVVTLGGYEPVFWLLAGALVVVSLAVVATDPEAGPRASAADDPGALRAESGDAHLDDVTGLEIARRLHAVGDPRGRPRGDDVAGAQGHETADVGHELAHREDHVRGGCRAAATRR